MGCYLFIDTLPTKDCPRNSGDSQAERCAVDSALECSRYNTAFGSIVAWRLLAIAAAAPALLAALGMLLAPGACM